MLTIVGFYTDDFLYSEHARLLKDSAKKNGLNIELQCYKKDEWQKIIAMKSSFILEKRKKIKGKILYIDVDAVILENIQPFFESINEDVGIHFLENKLTDEIELISSTIFINDTYNALKICEEWVRRQIEQPDIWDQKILQEIIQEWERKGSIIVNRLPANYTYIFDISKAAYGYNCIPAIEQLQASRDIRWLDKYKKRPFYTRIFMKYSKFSKASSSIIARHNHVNERAEQLGSNVYFSLEKIAQMAE